MDLAHENAYPTPFANTPILPLLLLSLMQQKNAPTTSNEFGQEYDYIIVGAGSAGSVLAGRLSEVPCASVLLLEAGGAPPLLTDVPALGPFFYESDVSWNYKTMPQRHAATDMVDNQVPWPSGKALGGSSMLNAMLYVRGNKRNFDMWAEQGAVGWSASDVWPYFLKMEDNTEPEYIADGFYDVETTTRTGQRCSTAKAYLVPAENRTNLNIVTKAFVQKVVIEGGRATKVLFEKEGVAYLVKARKEVILSAGAVNSAQLLMLSGIGPREHLEQFGIPVVADLPVGENFQDHCGTFSFFELYPSLERIDQQLKDPNNALDYIQNRRGILASTGGNPMAFLTSDPNQKYDFPEFQIVWAENLTPSPYYNYNLKPEIVEEFSKYANSTIYTCFPQFLQPRSRGTVRLQSADPSRPPLIDPDYYQYEEDLKTVVEGLKVCHRIGTSDAMTKLGSRPVPYPGCEGADDDQYFACMARSLVATLNHQVGTAKMGDLLDPTTVVDPRLRVKGIKGLRVVDASIMPIVPSGNTNVPTIMIGEKAADMIKETLDCYTQTPV